MSRQDEIECFICSDRIWPPLRSHDKARFGSLLRKVLSRLPDSVFDRVTEDIWFVLDVGFLAANVPYKQTLPASGGPITLTVDMVIIYKRAFELDDKALQGLIVHEIAHTFVEDAYVNHAEVEDKANRLVMEWGLGEELQALLIKLGNQQNGSTGRSSTASPGN